MRSRCNNPRHQFYRLYGERGIKVCPEWARFDPFEAWAKASGWQPGLTIDRIDTDGDYTPKNCRWADMVTQNKNRRPSVVGLAVEHDGEIASLLEWSRRTGVYYTTLVKRFHKGLRGAALFALVKGAV